MLDNPLVSIVVATKNRSKFINFMVQGFSLWSNKFSIELIIQDNSDQPDKNLVHLIEQSQVRYFHNSSSLDMKGNYMEALFHASGEYITFIGDDDFVLPEIVNAALYLKKTKFDALTANRAIFLWPEVNSFWQRNNTSGYLHIPAVNQNIQTKDISQGLSAILSCGGAHYDYELPSVYHGLIAKKLLIDIYDAHGSIFASGSPDLSNAVLVSFYTKDFVMWDKSFIVSGASKGSGASEGYSKSHHGDLAKRSYLNANTQDWPAKIPKFFSGPIIYTFTLLNTLKMVQNEYLPSKINYVYLYALCIINNPSYYKKIYPLIFESMSIEIIMDLFLAIADNLLRRMKQFAINFLIILSPKNRKSIMGYKLRGDIDNSYRAQKLLLQNIDQIY